MFSGSTEGDIRLEDNDLISVSSYGKVVWAAGAVKRPMRYEIIENENIEDLLQYSGGFAGNAYPNEVYVERVKYQGRETGATSMMYAVPNDRFGSFVLEDGDSLSVRETDLRFANRVNIEGAVWRPGDYSLQENITTLDELITAAGGLKEEAYLQRGYIVRYDSTRSRAQLSFSLQNVILGGDKIMLQPDDSVRIFFKDSLVQKRTVTVDGEVNKPGEFEYRYADVGAAAIDRTGNPYPDETHEICMTSDSVLFGAIGDPKYDNDPKAKVRPEQGLLKMRKALGLYANIRPVKPYASLLEASPLKNGIVEGADFVVVRELTGGMYFGEPRGRNEAGDKAFDTCVYSKAEIERVTDVAFAYASRRRGRVTLVDKANVLATSRLWRETVKEIHAAKYPDMQLDFMFVDNAAMKMVSNPRDFDVILTENMFGDILSDLAGVINGSIGLLPSASTGVDRSLYEPIHGSFPQGAGRNIANPIAMILSAAMMIEDAFGAVEEGALVRRACDAAVAQGVCTPDIVKDSPYGTKETGKFIIDYIKNA